MPSIAERTVRVPERFCGPPESGNGGYACGLLAQAFSGAAAVECTIRKPIPMESGLRIETTAEGMSLLQGEEIIIQAVETDFDLELPTPIPFHEAQAASKRSPAFDQHPFPTCFVCGPQRDEEDGLRIFPAPARSQTGFENLYAAEWTPPKEFADAEDMIRPEFIWAAMDCPTGFAAGFPYQGKLVTGRLAVKLLCPVASRTECVVMSWSTGNEGRKCHAAAALFDDSGKPLALAKATWIRLV